MDTLQTMMSLRMKLIYVLIALLTLPVAADDSQALVTRLASLTSFAAEFQQITLDGRGNHVQAVQGEVAVKRPGLLRWHTQPPLEQLIVSDGQQMWLYDPDLEQVTVQTLDQRITQTPALLLSGKVEDIQSSYQVSLNQANGLSVFTLVPVDPESLFEQIKLTFNDEHLSQMHITDSLGQRSSFEFINAQVNPELAPTLFQFTPPAGVDVISQ